MYMSVSDAAEKFNISKRRVQLLCEQGRIEGADRMSGVWLIPADAQKPIDARRKNKVSENQLSLFDALHKIDSETLNIAQVCELLSISKATVKNWVRLGKLKIDSDGETFDKKYIETLLTDIKSGRDSRLKSRRNKKSVSGKVLYKDYIKNNHNRKIVEDILNSCEQITEDELRVILADFAIQLYKQRGGTVVSKDALFEGKTKITNHSVFNDLIGDLLGNLNVSGIDLTKLQTALGCKVQLAPSEDTLGIENLYGQDIDEISILIARINMFLFDNSITKEQLYSQFICGNTLSDTFSRKFSVILGNPPWGYDFSKEETTYLTANYTTAKNKGMESYDLFVEKGLAMLEEDGYLAYVLPEAILTVASHQQARELIAKSTAFKFVSYLGNAFSGVQCPAVILGIQNGYQGETKGCRIELGREEFTINKNRDIDSTLFSFNMNDDEYDCLRAISSVKNAERLADNAKFALGIVTGNNKEYIKGTKIDGMESILKGSDIFRYTIKKADNYIHFTPEKFQQAAPTEMYRAKEKLLYRFIAEVPVFAYDNQQTLSLNSCNILIPQIEGMNIKYILAILNSSVAAYFINKKYNSVKLLRSHIESLPIPVINAERQKDIIKKVDHIMNSNENISGLYEELDNEIMNIYSLSEKQRHTIHTALSDKSLFLPF